MERRHGGATVAHRIGPDHFVADIRLAEGLCGLVGKAVVSSGTKDVETLWECSRGAGEERREDGQT